jgi:hypothetical protein
MLTLKERSSQTGLIENVIRKHMRLLGSFLKPYIKRGESNKLLFDSNCVVVFNEIKKLKAEGKTAKEITAFLKEVYSAAKDISYHKISPSRTDQTEEPTPEIEELYRMLLAEKDKRIHEIDKRDLKIVRLEIKNVKLQESIKLLPDGKKPGKIRKEWYQARKKAEVAAITLSELKECSCFRFFKRKNSSLSWRRFYDF